MNSKPGYEMRKPTIAGLTFLTLVTAPLAAQAADYATTIAATSPTANFRLTAPGTPDTVAGYTTTYTPTTGTGVGAPIASDPGNTGATFAGDNSAPSEVRTGLFGNVPGKGTINLWAKLSALPSTLGHTFALAGESQAGNDLDFQIEPDNVLRFYTGSGENTAYALDPTSLVDQWHMLTASYDGTLGSNGFRNLYLDGVRIASFTGTVNGAAKSSQFTIGYNDVFGGRDFAGSLDEVTLWNYGLNDDQIANIYASRLVGAQAAAVPEPATWAMMVIGFVAVGGTLRRRSIKATYVAA